MRAEDLNPWKYSAGEIMRPAEIFHTFQTESVSGIRICNCISYLLSITYLKQ